MIFGPTFPFFMVRQTSAAPFGGLSALTVTSVPGGPLGRDVEPPDVTVRGRVRATSGPSCDGSGAAKASIAINQVSRASASDAPWTLHVQAMWHRFRTIETLRSMGPRLRGDDKTYSAECSRLL
jgi:hypothetical protein